MRKIFIIFTLLLVSLSALYAGQVGLNPWHGGFGVDMASTKYNYDASKLEWISPESYAGGNIDDEISPYTDTHMIALGGVWNMESHEEQRQTGDFWGIPIYEYYWVNESDDEPMRITAECDNGFYFESISNPGARRPFKLYLLVKESYSSRPDMYSQTRDSDYGRTNGTVRFFELKEGKLSSDPIYYTYITPSNYSSDKWSDSDHIHSKYLPPYRDPGDYKYQYIWFDVILCLPYDGVLGENYVTSGGKMKYDNREYTLVEADDYTAIVTLTIEWNGQEKKLTIPLRGYYSANIEEQDSTASLSVSPRSSAANLSIETMQGVEVPIADIDFMATGVADRNDDGSFKYDSNGKHTYSYIKNFYMFLSASRNPFNSDPNGFRLVKRGIDNPSSPYTEQYIGFTLRVSPTNIEGANQNIDPVDFDGTKKVDMNASLANESGLLHLEARKNTDTGVDNNTVAYTHFQGVISIIMDQATSMMEEGIYEEEIYVHIVTDENAVGIEKIDWES